MKNRILAPNNGTLVNKPINASHIKTLQQSNNSGHMSIIDKLKHGLQESEQFVKAHTVDEVKKLANAVDNKAHAVVNTIEQDVSKGAHMAVNAIKSGANDVLKGAAAVENTLLPSGSKIIMETGLAVAGLGIIAVLAVKFL